ncbi:MAG: hypothetical protein P8K08_19675 [Fuerstiella sp.]|nr:hypothetical protein [Fuerstiella sp.]
MLFSLAKLKRIKAQLQGSAEAAVAVPYEVRCVCGQPVSGMRRTTWIEGECQSCYQSVFVLPTNVYPSTPSVPSEFLGGTFSHRLVAVVAELFPPSEQQAVDDSNRPVSSAEVADTERAADTERSQEDVRWRPSLPSFHVKTAVLHLVTPFRLLMLAMVTVVALTGYWMTYQWAVEAAHRAWLKSADDVQVQLERRDFLQMETVLLAAVDAGRILKKSDPEWRGTLNLLQETQAINSIAPGSLLSAFQQAYDSEGSLVNDAEILVREQANSGTFVFDSFLHAHPSSDNLFLMDLPATPGRHSVEVTIAVARIKDLLDAGGDDRVLFAGRICSVAAPSSDSRHTWKLQIDPGSFVLLTHPVHCEEIGLSQDADSDVAHILTRQRDFVEASERWEHRTDDAVSHTAFTESSSINALNNSHPEE